MSDSDEEFHKTYTKLRDTIKIGDKSASSASTRSTPTRRPRIKLTPKQPENPLVQQENLRQLRKLEFLKNQERLREKEEKIRQEQEKIRQEEEKIRQEQRMKDEETWNKAKDKLKNTNQSIQPDGQPHNKYNESFLPENLQQPQFTPTLPFPGVYWPGSKTRYKRIQLENEKWLRSPSPSPLGRGGCVKTRRRHKYKKSFTKRILQRRSKLTKARRHNGDK